MARESQGGWHDSRSSELPVTSRSGNVAWVRAAASAIQAAFWQPRHVGLLRLGAVPYTEHMSSSENNVNYDSTPVAETAIDGTEYRIDAGKQGTAICVSTRAAGSWDWSFLCEARWDGSELRSKSLERSIRSELSRALSSATQDL